MNTLIIVKVEYSDWGEDITIFIGEKESNYHLIKVDTLFFDNMLMWEDDYYERRRKRVKDKISEHYDFEDNYVIQWL